MPKDSLARHYKKNKEEIHCEKYQNPSKEEK